MPDVRDSAARPEGSSATLKESGHDSRQGRTHQSRISRYKLCLAYAAEDSSAVPPNTPEFRFGTGFPPQHTARLS